MLLEYSDLLMKSQQDDRGTMTDEQIALLAQQDLAYVPVGESN